MKISLVALLPLCSLLIFGCDKKDESTTTKTSGDLATAPADYVAAAGKAGQSMEKQIDTAALTKQIELFGAQEGRYPTNLTELVAKKYLNKLPVPPFGSKLQYDAKEGKVSLVKE